MGGAPESWWRRSQKISNVSVAQHSGIPARKGLDNKAALVKLVDPPQGYATVWNLSDILLNNELYKHGFVFELINAPAKMPPRWSLHIDSGYGHLPKLGYWAGTNNKPESFEVFHVDDPTNRLKLKRKLDSMDWFSVPEESPGAGEAMGRVMLLVLFRAKALAGPGIKLQ